jgi:hypothetical protein
LCYSKIGPPYHVSTLEKGALVGFGDGILGIHRKVLAKGNGQTRMKSQQWNVGDGGIDVVYFKRCIECR